MGDAQTLEPTNANCADDARYMARALEIAREGLGQTAPNPVVGCVIVNDGRIVGEGYHARAGGPHAEIIALGKAGDAAHRATAYVTLEPCNHHGRTGPCADALVKAGVREVVYALADPNPQAAGGAMYLRSAGIKVRGDILADRARELNRAWIHTLSAKRPYVIGKTAMTLDGRIATAGGESQWITGPQARRAGHELRAMSDAIIVGADTVIADDPALTARLDDRVHAPLRIVLDSAGRTSPGAKVYERSGRGAVLATTNALPSARKREFEKHGVDILTLPAIDARPDLHTILDTLYTRDIVTAMVEGGGAVLGAFFDADLIDEIHLFIAPKLFGGGKPALGGDGVANIADAARFDFSRPEPIGDDFVIRGRRKAEIA